MSRYIIRRLTQSVFTVFGVMLLTFLLFRIIAGDVSTAYVNQKLGVEARRTFYEKHKLDRPAFFNLHNRMEIYDKTSGSHITEITDINGSNLANLLGLHIAPRTSTHSSPEKSSIKIVSNLIRGLSLKISLQKAVEGKQIYTVQQEKSSGSESDTSSVKKQKISTPALHITLCDGSSFKVDITGLTTFKSLVDAINNHKINDNKLIATISPWSIRQFFNSQFFWHLYENITFSGRSYATDQSLLEIIAERAKFSLALTVPAMALGWLIAMIISCFVAYYRGTWIDRMGVFVTVLGMCIPYLAYMLLGQWTIFKISPGLAVGLSHPMSIYVPVTIAVVAGVGASVRFYRTIILDEINRDYVRTARSKGVPLPSILFIHVLKNCMLPILTNLISSIPFLIMGSLLLERFFGIPGLGDLMLTSITSRDVPIITGLTFLTSVLYVISLLVTDILYALFDPRIRLQ